MMSSRVTMNVLTLLRLNVFFFRKNEKLSFIRERSCQTLLLIAKRVHYSPTPVRSQTIMDEISMYLFIFKLFLKDIKLFEEIA